ncbi:MFS transporter [Filimonas lacunae]|nr:MFS transporter [Filimonas lacunae]
METSRVHRIAVSIFFFIAGLVFSSWTCRIPDIKMQLQLSDGALGSVLFALPVGLMASLPVSGFLVTRYGSRSVLILAATLYPITLIFLGLAGHVWQLVTGLVFFGLWSNMLNISVNTQAVSVEGLYGRSIMASFHGLWSLAGFGGGFIGFLLSPAGVPPFIHYLCICGVCLLLVLFTHKYLVNQDVGSGSGQPLFAKPDSVILKLGVIAFSGMVCEGTMFDWSGVYFQKIVLVPKQYVIFGFVAFMSTMAGGRFTADWMVTRIGVTKVLQISGICIASGLLLAVALPYFVTATIGFLLVGIGVSSVVPLVYGLAGKSKTMSPGVALAAVSTIGFVGFLIGPPIIGFVAEAASLKSSFTLVAMFGIATALLASQTRTK